MTVSRNSWWLADAIGGVEEGDELGCGGREVVGVCDCFTHGESVDTCLHQRLCIRWGDVADGHDRYFDVVFVDVLHRLAIVVKADGIIGIVRTESYIVDVEVAYLADLVCRVDGHSYDRTSAEDIACLSRRNVAFFEENAVEFEFLGEFYATMKK